MQNLPFTCRFCSKGFYRESNLLVHNLKHLQGYDCPTCNVPHSTWEDLQSHTHYDHPQPTVGYGVIDVPQQPEYQAEWKLLESTSKENAKFRSRAATFKVQLENTEHYTPSVENLGKLFTKLMEEIVPDAALTDMVGVTFEAPTLDFPIIVPYIRYGKFTSKRLFSVMENALNSNETFGLDRRLKITVDHVVMPTGSGRTNVASYSTLQEAVISKRGVVFIRKDSDHLCLPTAILVGIEHYKKFKANEENLYEEYRGLQRRRLTHTSNALRKLKKAARALLRKAGVDSTAPCGVPELKKIQTVLPDYQLYLFSATANYGGLFEGPEADRRIYIILDEQYAHYHLISNPASFYGAKSWCKQCEKFYSRRF